MLTEAELIPVLLILNRTRVQKPGFTLVQVTFKGDMSEYSLMKELVNVFSYVRCKCKVKRDFCLFNPDVI